MSEFDWSDEKNEWLEQTRGICFEDVLVAIENGQTLSAVGQSVPGRVESKCTTLHESHWG